MLIRSRRSHSSRRRGNGKETKLRKPRNKIKKNREETNEKEKYKKKIVKKVNIKKNKNLPPPQRKKTRNK